MFTTESAPIGDDAEPPAGTNDEGELTALLSGGGDGGAGDGGNGGGGGRAGSGRGGHRPRRWLRVTGWSLAGILAVLAIVIADAYFLVIARHSSDTAAWAVTVAGGLVIVAGLAALVVRDRSLAAVPAVVLIVAVLIGAGIYLPYRHLWGQITVDPIKVLGPQPTKVVANAENFLLLGTDSRAGKGDAKYGKNSGCGCSDTTILVHLSSGDRSATMVSIPRDSWVQIPACLESGGGHSTPQMNKFNAAFAIGGPSCTIATVEKLTHVKVDHYAVIDFNGFINLVKAMGGVRMCVAQPLEDPVHINPDTGGYVGSGLNLPAGRHVLIDGFQALALMRARYGLGDGSDIQRITRQQQFIGAMIRKVFSTGLLVDLPKLYRVLDAATKTLTTDGFGIGEMKKLANAVHDVGAGGVRLLTVPLADPLPPGVPTADVAWDPTKAPALWHSIRFDQPLPGTKPSPGATPTPTPTPTGPALTVPPASIDIAVENGTGQDHLAHTVAAQLTALGYHVVSIGDAPSSQHATTLVEYGSDKKQSSQTVAAAIPGSVRRAAAVPTTTTITVIIGSNFTKTQQVTLTSVTPTPSATPSIAATKASKEGCLS